MVVVYWNVNSVEIEDRIIVCRDYKRMDVDEFLRLIEIGVNNINITENSNIKR